jgi:hypothetical protein
MIPLARWLIILGLILMLAGGMIYILGRFGIPLGHLPGDIRIQTDNFTCIFPLTTMIIVSVLLTILLNVIIRLLNR